MLKYNVFVMTHFICVESFISFGPNWWPPKIDGPV